MEGGCFLHTSTDVMCRHREEGGFGDGKVRIVTANIYYCGQESLRRNGVALTVNKRVQNALLGCNLKNNRMISVRFQGKPYHSNPSLCPNTIAKVAEVERSMKTYKIF